MNSLRKQTLDQLAESYHRAVVARKRLEGWIASGHPASKETVEEAVANQTRVCFEMAEGMREVGIGTFRYHRFTFQINGSGFHVSQRKLL